MIGRSKIMCSVIPTVLSSATPTTINSGFAAFCLLNRRIAFSRHRHVRKISNFIPLNLSQEPSDRLDDISPSQPTPPSKNWFMDGREAARQLKMELGMMNNNDIDDDLDSESKEGDDEDKLTMNEAILESGRAAARELLKSMNIDEPENDGTESQPMEENPVGDKAVHSLESISDEGMQTISEATNQPPLENHPPEDNFNLPSRKSHCMTICLVPPASATKAWGQLTEARRECKDPGFFRWPPHANILYPFLDPVYDKDGDESKDEQRAKFRNEIAMHLTRVAERCEPFDVTIDSFGTFGGKHRGVLWAYPKSSNAQDGDDEKGDDEPLMALHGLLERQFPMCTDQRKNGAFHPHITISHYVNNDDALAAKEEVESKWDPVSFHVPEIYLLERKGDDGQFKILATIPLGAGSEVKQHDPPMPFPDMPEVEEEWVYDERMAMKNRRKKGNKRRRRGGRSKERDASNESVQEKS